MRVRLRVVMLVCVLSLLLSTAGMAADPGSGGSALVPVKKVSMPAAQAPADGDLLVYFRLRTPQDVVNQLGDWVGMFQPGMNAEALSGTLQMMGLDLSQLRAGGNAAAFLWFKSPSGEEQQQPAAGGGSPSLAVLIPASPESQLAKTIAERKPDVAQGTVAGDLLLAKDQASLGLAKKDGEELAKLAKAPLTEDLQAYVNLDGLMRLFGPMVHGFAGMAGAKVGETKVPGQSADQQAQVQRLVKGELNAALRAVGQVSDMTLLADVEKNHLELSTVVKAKPESKLAAFLTGGPSTAPDLSRYLAPGYVMGMQLSVSDTAGLIEVYEGMIKRMSPPDQPEGLQQLLNAMDGWKQIKSLDYAFAMYGGDQGRMRFNGVMRTSSQDQAETLLKLMRESPKIMESGAFGAFSMGVKYHVKVHQGARQLAGHAIDRYEMSLEFPEGFPKQQTQMMKRMYGDTMVCETMKLGRSVLVALNEPVDALYRRFESPPAGAGLAAMKEFEPGAAFYADVDVARYLEMVGTMLSHTGKAAATLPKVSGPPLTIAGYHQNGTGWYRLRVPRELVADAVQEIQKFRQQKALEQQQKQEEQQGQEGGEQEGKPANPPAKATPAAR